MKKKIILTVIVFLILILLILIGYHFYQDNFAPVEIVPKPSTQIDYYKGVNIVPSEIEKDKIEETIKDIKNLGVNIIVINLDLFINNKGEFELNGPPDADLKRQIAQIVAEAHRQGLHTELRTVTGSPMMMEANRISYEEILTNAKEFVLNWTQFAQEHDVLQFTLFGEVDSFRINCTSNFEANLSQFSKSLLEEARTHYDGKVGMGFLPPTGELNYDLTGYDYIEISIYIHTFDSYQNYEEGFSDQVANIQQVLARSDIDTIIMGETGVTYDPLTGKQGFDIEVTESIELEYYNTLFESISSELDGMYVGYNVENSQLSVSNVATENVVKKWFSEL